MATNYLNYFNKLKKAGQQEPGSSYTPPSTALPGYKPIDYGKGVESKEIEYGATTPYTTAGYGDIVQAPSGVPWQSSYSPELWAKLEKEHMTGLTESMLPGYELAMAKSREEAQQRVGRSGLVAEAEKPIHKDFIRRLSLGAGEFQKQKIGAQMADRQERMAWERQQEQIRQDRIYTQELDKAGWGRTQGALALGEEFKQKLAAAGWGRKEKGRVLGEQFAQQLDRQQWDRAESYKQQERDADIALQQGLWSREDYMNAWNSAKEERVRNIEYTRQDIMTALQIAVDENNWEKEKALRVELANIEKEATESAAMWGAIGSVVGIGAMALGGAFKKPPVP